MEWIGHHSHAHEPTRWVSACGRAEVQEVPLPRSPFKWRALVDGHHLLQGRQGRFRQFKTADAAKRAAQLAANRT